MDSVESFCPSLAGTGVQLEPLVEAHAAEMLPLVQAAGIWTYVDTPPPSTLEALAARYRRLESRSSPDRSELWLNWAVRVESRLVGFVEATVFPDALIEVAYFTGKPYWVRGYATEATRTMLAFLAERFPTAKFEAVVDARNIASLKLLERLDFVVVDDADPQHLRLRRYPPADRPSTA